MQVWDAFDATKRSETHAARRYALVTRFRRVGSGGCFRKCIASGVEDWISSAGFAQPPRPP
jgi:hypothetical protein